ncbi:MAG: penicillin-binding protein 2 [Planctomycetaceae bacterium]|nr:penicillin-binding protein 2 [Planctomycetaceae bacterium]
MNNLSRRELILTLGFLIAVSAAFAGLIYRLYDLQVRQKSAFIQISRKQQNAVVPEKPRRGLILDSRGRVLAASARIYNVFVEPRRLREFPDQILIAASELQPLLNLPGDAICQKIRDSRNPGFLRIKEDITPAERHAVDKARFNGVGIETGWTRSYPAGSLTAHLLGFIGAEETGLSGLELQYERTLSGAPGRQVFVVDALRRPIGTQPYEAVDPRDGLNLVLTIDSVIQRFVREALEKQVKAFEAESAVAIAMDPQTGAVLAMVSLPDFDPTKFSVTKQDQMRNRILTDSFEPGSVFKPIVAAVALDSGKVAFNERFDCEKGYWARYRIGEFGNHQYGVMSVKEILINSSNIGMAKIGVKMGKKTIYDGMTRFGFSQKTKIDLPGEEPGLLRPLNQWSGWSVTRIPFGHEISVTALQVCRAYSILANGGYVIQPHIVRAILDDQGSIVEDRRPVRGTGYIVDPKIASWIVGQALVGVVNEGTGDLAKLKGVQVWGKTGTANIALPNGGYDTRNYVSSFVGGAPVENARIVVMASIRKPNRALGKGYSGGRVAAPVVGEILQKTLTYWGVLPEETSEVVASVK